MTAFPSPLILRAWSAEEITAFGVSSQFYTLGAEFVYNSERFGELIVPAGLVTDFASIPRAVWAIISPEDPEIMFPSVVHDFIYTVRGVMPSGKVLTRKNADEVLREAMAVCGSSSWRRQAVYSAVQMFGSSHWKT